MPKLLMLSGLPASGKSTLAKKLVKESGNIGRVNRDDLRAMLFNSEWSGKREGVVVECEKAIAKVLFQNNMGAVIDDTNLSKRHRDMWSEFTRSNEQSFETRHLDVGVWDCVNRDKMRIPGVGPAVIFRLALNNGMIAWDKPIVLCDIDGTIASGEDRASKYLSGEKKDWDGYYSELHFDKPIESVVRAVRFLKEEHTVCLVSARPDTYQWETIEWLANHDIPWDWLFMRAGSDRREDSVVKKEILDKMPKHRIDLVLDDRPRVIRMWRENGLTVYAARGEDCEEF
jgi:predicted kinase